MNRQIFTKNPSAAAALVSGLISFFGDALGCSDGTISHYTGKALNKIHQPIMITPAASTNFNQVLLGVLTNATVAPSDVQFVGGYLQSLTTSIVYQSPSASFCDRYSSALGLSNYGLINYTVSNAFQLFLADPVMNPYFTGQTPQDQTNFQTNAAAGSNLLNGVIDFFGVALGCTDGTIPKYTGKAMDVIHQPLYITQNANTQFTVHVIAVLNMAGVTTADQNAVQMTLQSLNSQIVNPQASPVAAPGGGGNPYTGPVGQQPSPILTGGQIAGIIIGCIIAFIVIVVVLALLTFKRCTSPSGSDHYVKMGQ